MNLRTLFEPIDRVIAQARNYIHEQEIRKKNIFLVEEKVKEIIPELNKRKEELDELIGKIDPKDSFRKRLENSVRQLEEYVENVELIAERELLPDIVEVREKDSESDKKELRHKYVKHQSARLEEQIKATNNFFEVADFANEIWADFDLFEEFGQAEVIVQLLVNQMNLTNAKNTETRIGKDLKKTLEHIRLNLVKSSAWTEEEIKEYQVERNLKLKQLRPVNIPDNRKFNVGIIGGGPQIIEKMEQNYFLPKRLCLEWFDIKKKEALNSVSRNSKHDLFVFCSMLPKHKKFLSIKDSLSRQSIVYADLISFDISRLVKILEEELIRITFKDQFGGK